MIRFSHFSSFLGKEWNGMIVDLLLPVACPARCVSETVGNIAIYGGSWDTPSLNIAACSGQ